MNISFENNFKKPHPIYRSAPFWSVNDKLQVKELKYQVDKMIEGGFSPGFFHSRIGLVTEYMSEDWIKCIKETAKHSKKRKVPFYLYDEDRWPSGFAGGIVSRKKKNWIKLLKIEKINGKWKASVVYGEKSEWFNNTPYVDLMNKETVDDFINSTYEVYGKKLKKYLGDTIPAIFTDEPNYYAGRSIKREGEEFYLPWTKNFREVFKKKYGYDIVEKVEYLVEEKNGFEKVRYDYYRLLTELFVENFTKNIYDFCEKNKIALTGHFLAEDTLEAQITVIGKAMSHYEYMQWPGIDHLGRNINQPLTVKQCSSVANQLGKERALSELYGCSGQNFTLYERKWIGDWHIALGINFFCPHLYLYSLKGARKRDYPPTMSHHQPYWKFNHLIEDYFARLNYTMTRGKFKSNILVIHPVESGWTVFKSEKIKKLDEFLSSLTEKLLEGKFEYEFGDEGLIEKYGKINNGKIKIKNSEYDTVIIPHATTLRKKTVELLLKFKGKIFAYQKFPYLVEGEENESIKNLKRKCILYKSVKSLTDLLEKGIKREISIKSSDKKDISPIYMHRREYGEDEILFFINTSLNEEFKVNVKLNYKGNVLKLNPFNGEIHRLPVKMSGKEIEFSLEFPPAGSNLLIVEKNKSPLKGNREKLKETGERRIDNWQIKLNNENVLVIDYCKYRIKGMKKWSGKKYILDLQNYLEKKDYKGKVDLLFEFNIKDVPEKLDLIVEDGDRFKIKVNGKQISSKPSGSWIDKVFKVIPLQNFKKGKNEIVLSINFKPPKKKGTLIFKEDGVELETIFIKGNFALQTGEGKFENGGYFHKKFSIKKVENITDKDLNLQGYPFYIGSFTAKKEIEIERTSKRYFLKFDKFKCIVAEVKINGKSAGCVFIPPFEIEITDLLKKGKNKIEIDFYTSLRNLFGPHHLKNPNPQYVGPNSFIKFEGDMWYDTNWTNFYSTLPTGIGEIKIVEKK